MSYKLSFSGGQAKQAGQESTAESAREALKILRLQRQLLACQASVIGAEGRPIGEDELARLAAAEDEANRAQLRDGNA